ncbi:PH domain-containing protein [Clostridium estertheticum]|uniref:PH domain-containing protein n=1 Tax=Clostridium estertheticum TaxID=238834 RepID=UPI0013E9638A|nr:PH domain-containing protein [Clostridium estertheticum]MBZ9688702.1 PH domain-containing protein [Clostridium estertheticum]
MEREIKNNIAFKERKRLMLFGLPFTFTLYNIQEDKLTIQEGFINREINDCYLYKIQDTTLNKSLFERVFGLGTIICHTGDVTHPTLVLKHIKNSDAIKEYLFETSEQSRLKRRTVNMQNIGAENLDEVE